MKRSRGLQRAVAGTMAVIFSVICLFVAPAQAVLVGTAEILHVRAGETAPEASTIDGARHHIVQTLESWGVASDEATKRAGAMTDEEARRVAQALQTLPAGAGLLEFVALIALLGFITLVVTDILGITDVFTFVKKM